MRLHDNRKDKNLIETAYPAVAVFSMNRLPPNAPPVEEPPNEPKKPPVKEPPPEDPNRRPPHPPTMRLMHTGSYQNTVHHP